MPPKKEETKTPLGPFLYGDEAIRIAADEAIDTLLSLAQQKPNGPFVISTRKENLDRLTAAVRATARVNKLMAPHHGHDYQHIPSVGLLLSIIKLLEVKDV